MSHNYIVNAQYFDQSEATIPGNSVAALSWSPINYSAAGLGIAEAAVGKTIAWRTDTIYGNFTFPSGWSVSNGPNTAIQPRYQYAWRDRISVPTGTWLCEIKTGTRGPYDTGRIAIYDSANNRVSPVISWRDNRRASIMIARITGPILVEVKVVTASVNIVPTYEGHPISSIVFKKV